MEKIPFIIEPPTDRDKVAVLLKASSPQLHTHDLIKYKKLIKYSYYFVLIESNLFCEFYDVLLRKPSINDFHLHSTT